jgi:hypothetical protein
MNNTILRSILNKAIACRHSGIGGFTEDEANAAMSEVVAIDVRADQATKEAARNEQERLAREAGGEVVFALDEFAKSLGFVQVASYEQSRHYLERHEFAHVSLGWFLCDVTRDGTRIRVEVPDELAGRSFLQRVHDGAGLQSLASELGSGTLIKR